MGSLPLVHTYIVHLVSIIHGIPKQMIQHHATLNPHTRTSSLLDTLQIQPHRPPNLSLRLLRLPRPLRLNLLLHFFQHILRLIHFHRPAPLLLANHQLNLHPLPQKPAHLP